jgi:hypothetical protein
MSDEKATKHDREDGYKALKPIVYRLMKDTEKSENDGAAGNGSEVQF